MKVYDNLEQNTPEWMRLRNGIVTASAMQQVLSKARGGKGTSVTRQTYMDKLIAERLTGRFATNFTNDDMFRGHEMEGAARDAYSAVYGVEVDQPAFITNYDEIGTVGFSPDGLVGKDGGIEIKSRADHVQVKMMREMLGNATIPNENKAQVQCGLWVSEREWIDYISFNDALGIERVRVYRDEPYIKEMSLIVKAFNIEMMEWVEKLRNHMIEAPAIPQEPDIIDEFISGDSEPKEYRA